MENFSSTLSFLNHSTWTDERTIVLKMSTPWKMILWLVIMTSLTFGSVTKIHIYRHLFKTSLKEQPFNILILMEQTTYQFCETFVLLHYLLSLMLDLPIAEVAAAIFGNTIDENSYCWVFHTIHIFGVIYARLLGTRKARLGTWFLIYLV